MKRMLAFPPDTKLEWKSHDSSIQQRTAIEESRRDKGAGRTAKQHHQQQPAAAGAGDDYGKFSGAS